MSAKTLFSEVEGTVSIGGSPVAGAVVEREYLWAWNDTRGSDSTVTAADGSFRLPAIHGRTLFGSILPHEPMVEQTIRIIHGGTVYELWVATKRNYRENGELGGRPIRLSCDLGNPAHRTEVDEYGTGFFGVCDLR